MSLQDKLNAVRAEAAATVPGHLRGVMEQAMESHIASGQAEAALKAGEFAPPFRLPDTSGTFVRSADLLRRGPLVLTFHRGAWCPYCNLDLQALDAAYVDIRATGASLVTVSQQTQSNSGISRRHTKIRFPMLSDKRGELARAFGIRSTLSRELQVVFKKLSIDLAALNGEASWTLPIPARYVIGQDSMIVYAEINPDHTHRPDPSELLQTLKRFSQSTE